MAEWWVIEPSCRWGGVVGLGVGEREDLERMYLKTESWRELTGPDSVCVCECVHDGCL